jgi:hypothetical protein
VQTDDLIRQLASEANPVRPLRPLPLRLLGWVVVAAVSLGVVSMVMGVRREFGDAVDQADFAVETALLIITALSAAVGALIISVPGGERSSLLRWTPVIAGIASVLWAAGELGLASATGEPTGRLTFGWHCLYKTAAVAAVPAVALFALVRQAAPTRAAWTGLLAILATAAVGVLGSNIICPYDRPLHMLVWHVAPLMLFAGAGAALGTWLLRWDSRRP